MLNEFITFFTEMTVIPAVLLIIGLIFCIIKIFQPGLLVFGYLGGLLVIAGIVTRMVFDGTVVHLFMMLFITFIILIFAYLIMVKTNRSSWFYRMAPEEIVVADNQDKKDVKWEKLVGAKGLTKTDIKPKGKVIIGGEVYDANSQNVFIPTNTKVRVIKVIGTSLYIEPLKREEN